MTYETFCSVHEDVLEWLIVFEDKLKAMDPVGSDLAKVRDQFHDIQAFLVEVLEQEGPEAEVGKTWNGKSFFDLKRRNVDCKKKRWPDVVVSFFSIFESFCKSRESEKRKIPRAAAALDNIFFWGEDIGKRHNREIGDFS